jgi:hypothetical protein
MLLSRAACPSDNTPDDTKSRRDSSTTTRVGHGLLDSFSASFVQRDSQCRCSSGFPPLALQRSRLGFVAQPKHQKYERQTICSICNRLPTLSLLHTILIIALRKEPASWFVVVRVRTVASKRTSRTALRRCRGASAPASKAAASPQRLHRSDHE